MVRIGGGFQFGRLLELGRFRDGFRVGDVVAGHNDGDVILAAAVEGLMEKGLG